MLPPEMKQGACAECKSKASCCSFNSTNFWIECSRDYGIVSSRKHSLSSRVTFHQEKQEAIILGHACRIHTNMWYVSFARKHVGKGLCERFQKRESSLP